MKGIPSKKKTNKIRPIIEQTNYSIIEHAIVSKCSCEYALFFKITQGVLKLCNLYIMQMCSLFRTIFYDIKVVPLTTLAAMRIGFRDAKKIL